MTVWMQHKDDHNPDKCTGITFSTVSALVVFLCSPGTALHFPDPSFMCERNSLLHSLPSTHTWPEFKSSLWYQSINVCALSEGCICLIPLQAQGKASARLKTCSAAQVKHAAMSHGNKDVITEFWRKCATEAELIFATWSTYTDFVVIIK